MRLIGKIIIISALFFALIMNTSGQKSGDLKLTPRIFESVSGEKVNVEFGQLTVPENRQAPNSRLIELAFVRFKSTSPNPGPPIVYLAGGPGSSGLAAARGTRFPLFLAMREVADVIALDQRGVGSSKPNLVCKETIDYAPDKIPNREDLIDLYRKQSRACAAGFKQQGVDLTGYNTNESADDLEDLRKALGAKKVSLWAISYGTHLALAAIKRHENSISRVILAGIEGPQQTVKLPSNIQKHLEHIERLVKADPGLSNEISSFTKLMKEVFDKVERSPVTVEVTDPQTKQKLKVTVNKFMLQLLTVLRFGSDEARLPAFYYAMSKGDYSAAALGWMLTVKDINLGSAMSFMMDCASGISPARRQRVEREAKTTLLGDVMDFPSLDVCDAWESPDLGEKFRANVKTKVPALFISGTFDVRTPPSNAEEVRRGFKQSTHLIIDGAVHSDPLFLSSPKIRDVMLEFMKGQKVSTTSITLAPLKFAPVR